MKTCTSIGISNDSRYSARQYQRASKRWVTGTVRWLGAGIALLACSLSLVAQHPSQPSLWSPSSLNVTACGYGLDLCDEGLLSPAEKVQVVAIRHRQNVTSCGLGLGQCNEGLLSNAEIAQVVAIRYRQNFMACRYGFPQCNQALLTQADVATLRPSNSRDECRAVVYLRPGSSETVVADRTPSSSTLGTLLNALARLAAPVAENGSYYGELNRNGVPKTVLVNGYTRSNGTYVQGYYRSAPGTNPIR